MDKKTYKLIWADNEKYNQYWNLKEWLISIGEDPYTCFVFEHGHHLPHSIIIDEATAVALKLK